MFVCFGNLYVKGQKLTCVTTGLIPREARQENFDQINKTKWSFCDMFDMQTKQIVQLEGKQYKKCAKAVFATSRGLTSGYLYHAGGGFFHLELDATLLPSSVFNSSPMWLLVMWFFMHGYYLDLHAWFNDQRHPCGSRFYGWLSSLNGPSLPDSCKLICIAPHFIHNEAHNRDS